MPVIGWEKCTERIYTIEASRFHEMHLHMWLSIFHHFCEYFLIFVHHCAYYSFNSYIVILLFGGNIKQIQFIIHAGWEQVWSAKRTQVQDSTWQTSAAVLYEHSYINTFMIKTLYKWISIWSLINIFTIKVKISADTWLQTMAIGLSGISPRMWSRFVEKGNKNYGAICATFTSP